MSRPLLPDDVVVGLLTENTPRMLSQATRLLRSIRWFGGGLAEARVVVCGVGSLEPAAHATLEALGAEIRTVQRFHPANPTANRHSLLAELEGAPERVMLQLDCDTLVVRDPLPFLRDDAFQAKLAPTPTVSDEVFERLFAHFGMEKPPRSHVAPWNGEAMIPYFNAGIFALPVAMARVLAPSWRKFNLVLADHPHLSAPCHRHMHQASLSLALAETGVPVVELPAEMNYQINAQHLLPPPGFADADPVIIHYHHLASDDGFLFPCVYPAAQARIESFHERMLAEGFVRQARPAPVAAESRPIIVAGMHRSGTSLVAQLIHALGAHAGEPSDHHPPDMFNPTGLWEHRGAAEINRDILAAQGATWSDVLPLDLESLPDGERAGFVSRAKELARSMEGRGAFVLKDPRLSLLLPIWRAALPGAICVIPWRHPVAVARSIATRDRLSLLLSIALWEQHNRTLLRDSEGMPRLLVSYDELLAEPKRVVRELHASLASLGVGTLTVPSDELLRQIVNRDFNRSGGSDSPDEALLDSEQKALLASLRSGSALREPTAPIAARTRELLSILGEMEKLESAQKAAAAKGHELAVMVESLQQRATLLDRLLLEVFHSRSWRIGDRLTGLLRGLRRAKALSSRDRWEELRGRTP